MSAAANATGASVTRRRGRLFVKYVLSLVGLVSVVLVGNGALDVWFSYREARETQVRIQQEKAESAARRIAQFVEEIEHQIGWVAQAQWAALPVEQRRIDYGRLQRQVPAITDLVQLDRQGHEQLRVSRISPDVIGSGINRSKEPAFVEAMANRVYFSPVDFHKDSEPYLTMAVAHKGKEGGVTIAEVNLKLILDPISQIKIGREGYAYVVDRLGRLIAHPDLSLVLRKTDLSALPQVAAALAETTAQSDPERVMNAPNFAGRTVLTAHAAIAPLRWLVFVELPIGEALQPLYASLARTGWLLLVGLVFATAVGFLLARRMVVPIRTLQEGAARLGAGELGHRIELRTGDEVETLADEFNRMAAQLQESHSGLERRVEERTRELSVTTEDLARSVEELTTLREVGQAVSSTLDLATVLETIVTRAVALSGADAGAIYRYRSSDRQFRLGTSHGFGEALAAAIRAEPIREEETPALGRAVKERMPVQLPDLAAAPHLPLRDLIVAAGFRSVLIVPLVGADRVVGVLAIQKKTLGEFSDAVVKLMQTFASQSVLAIQNARLFREVDEQGRALAIASQHKSQFLANMSHELRTPLNSILGYAEMMADGLYGDLGEKAQGVLERVRSNGRHLLGLINDVLDLSKIEAGQLVLAMEDYSVADMVATVMAATESLARAKNLGLGSAVARGLPTGTGDARRLAQVLLNLVGNAIKFTDQGGVEIRAVQAADRFEFSVVDSGPGIAPADQARIFDEFQQVDNTITRKKGGTGLGLSISRRIVELHGGRITVQSEVGKGSTFTISIPVNAQPVKDAAQ
jgi:signal transduction histidine kinase